MMRKFTTCLMICATVFFVSSCNDDVSSPPKSNLAVDKTSGLADETVFTFTIDDAPGAGTISLLPYGTGGQSFGGSQVVSGFTNGKATIQFKYEQVGKFDAVVVTNNHSADGKTVKNVYSTPITITISSGKNQITESNFALNVKAKDNTLTKVSTATTIDQTAHTVAVTVPYGTDLTALIATFTTDPFATVTVGSATQASGTTANNFTSPVSYTVTSDNGTANTYTVTVTTTPINTDVSLKSFKATEKNGKVLGSAWTNDPNVLVLYDTLNSPAANFKKLSFNYAFNNAFAALHKNGVAQKLAENDTLDFSSPVTLKALAQDSASVQHTYTIYGVQAPKIQLTSPGITIATVTTNFNILVKALKGSVTDSKVNLTFNVPPISIPSGVTLQSITLKDADHTGGIVVANGTDQVVNFSDAVTITLHVTDSNAGGTTYDVVYTAGLTELK